MIRQSLTWQASVRRGEVQGLKWALLRLGTLKFGPPDETARFLLTGQTELEQLERLVERILVVDTWGELLATP